MTLDTYLDRPGAMTLTALAGEVGVSKSRLSQLRDKTDWPADLALKIEGATGGALNASLLSPTVAKARQTGAAA